DCEASNKTCDFLLSVHLPFLSIRTPSAPAKCNWSNFVHQLPHFMHEYFADVIDVDGDSRCGFRAIFDLLGKSVEDHHIIRLELTIELNKNRGWYLTMFGSQERFD
ncbi:OTU-like cysteine protease, partial [Trifolium medium]|nr:OTU-like cysteine protease [Trifolium medium]